MIIYFYSISLNVCDGGVFCLNQSTKWVVRWVLLTLCILQIGRNFSCYHRGNFFLPRHLLPFLQGHKLIYDFKIIYYLTTIGLSKSPTSLHTLEKQP